uniref:Uncharacterized protein n=1 Tax=Opuntia streptacantha TaxID=393608 RepID=A0A7C9EB97_OPUST
MTVRLFKIFSCGVSRVSIEQGGVELVMRLRCRGSETFLSLSHVPIFRSSDPGMGPTLLGLYRTACGPGRWAGPSYAAGKAGASLCGARRGRAPRATVSTLAWRAPP